MPVVVLLVKWLVPYEHTRMIQNPMVIPAAFFSLFLSHSLEKA